MKILAALPLLILIGNTAQAEDHIVTSEEIHQMAAEQINRNYPSDIATRAMSWAAIDAYVRMGHKAGADLNNTCEDQSKIVSADNDKRREWVIATQKNISVENLDRWQATTMLAFFTACREVRGL
ncbi:hypothetical protein ACSZNZ_02585 [Aeromonas caviae]|uniref:hypothetical protein n=1 Tax=Aeromonas caviae TaxID=648 RepID=UPI003EC76385